MNYVAGTEGQRGQCGGPSQPGVSESIDMPSSPEISQNIGQTRGRYALEVVLWATFCTPLVIQVRAQVMWAVLQKSVGLFGRDCLGYWYYLCHHHTTEDESCTTYIQWREQADMENISWKSILVEGPIKLGQRLYPTITEFGKRILLPRSFDFVCLMVEISMLILRTLLGIVIALSPWVLKIMWPERHYNMARKEGFVVAPIAGNPGEPGDSVGYHIITSGHDDSTIVSEITHDGTILDGTILEGTIPSSIDGNSGKKAQFIQRLPIASIRSKWKKTTTGLRTSTLPISKKLRQSVLKQKVV